MRLNNVSFPHPVLGISDDVFPLLDNEIDDFIISLYKEHKKFEYSRTTEGNWMGII